MRTFGILQSAFPKRQATQGNRPYLPAKTWRLFHSSGRKYGLKVLFFRAEDVDFINRRVYAWSSDTANGNAGWKCGWHRFPDVLYENYPTGGGSRRYALSIKRKFARAGIPVFNPPFYDKAALQNILSRNNRIRPYLPATMIVKNTSNVTDFLNRYGFIYLKPVRGSQGKGIIEIRQLSRNRIRVQSDHLARNKTLSRTYSLPQFRSFVGRILTKNHFLIQRGLKLAKKGPRKIDFRVVVHRGIDGEWHCAGIRPKLGKPGSMVTNLHAGGSKTTWQKLKRWARQTRTPLPSAWQLQKPAIAAAQYLTKYRPTLSHLGIDIAVDRRNSIYLLDFNEVPGRRLLTSKMLRRVTKMTAGFARYLAAKR